VKWGCFANQKLCETTAMPSPFLRATSGRPPEFYCSLCKIKFEPKFPENTLAKGKAALQKEWDEHLQSAHPHQWERELEKRAGRRRLLNIYQLYWPN
jgi:hypothetical protein